jgi:hypothetical protein
MTRIVAAFALILASAVVASGSWITTVQSSAPLNWYRLDELAGSAAIDYGSQGVNGTYGSGVNAPARGAAGLVGVAAAFDGDRKNILLNNSPLTGDWSAEFIVKKTGTKVSAELIRGAPLEFPSSHLKLEQYPGTGQVGFTESFVVDHVFSPPVVAPLNEFVHLVYVKDNSGMKAYMDGTLAGTSASSVSLYRFQFGDTESESPIAVVDEIVVYGRALPAAEIAEHYLATPEPSSIALALVLLGVCSVAGASNRLRLRCRI